MFRNGKELPPTPLAKAIKTGNPYKAWEQVIANERRWAEKAYRALARVMNQRPVKMSWILDAMEAGDGPELARKLIDQRLPSGALSAVFLTAALDAGAMRIRDSQVMPGRGLDRDEVVDLDNEFEWIKLAEYLEPVDSVMGMASAEVFRDYLWDFDLDDIEEFHDFPLRELLQESGVKVDEISSDAAPLKPHNDTECGFLSNVKLDGVRGSVDIALDGFLFVPSGSRQRSRREVDESSLERKLQWAESRWWAWEETSQIDERKPGLLNETLTNSFYFRNQTLPYEIGFVDSAGDSHCLKWTYFTKGSGFKEIAVYFASGYVNPHY